MQNINGRYGVADSYQNSGGRIVPANQRLCAKMSQFIKNKSENRYNRLLHETSKVKSLFENQFLSSLSDHNFENILIHLELTSHLAGQYIYQSNDYIRYIYFPETAVFSQFSIQDDGRTIETAMIGSEGVTGIPAAFKHQPAKQFTQVLVSGLAMRLSVDSFKREFARCAEFRDGFLGFSENIFSQLSQKIICNNHHLLDGRLCNWLLMVSDRSKNNKINITHDQIAGLLGVHRPSVTHTAQLLRQQNIIKYSRGVVEILNRRRLEKAACDCYRQ